MTLVWKIRAVLLVAIGVILSSCAYCADVTGTGATFPYPIYAKWIDAYHAETGATVVYQPIGSALGIRMIEQKTVTFGASDMPLKPDELDRAGLVQFPTVVGGDVPVVNLPDVAPGQLVFDGPTLAAIYLGRIQKWNDPAIAKLNPDTTLPPLPITVVHRSDGSGTTFVWTDYLSKESDEWKKQVGANTAVEWPLGVAGRGNEGVAAAVAATSGAFGYVEYAYAVQNKLAYTRMLNHDGKMVSPSVDTFRAATAAASWNAASGFYVVLTDQPGDSSWPIAGATFILLERQPKNLDATRAAIAFFRWAFSGKGSDMALALNYVPLPDAVTKAIEATWQTATDR